VEWASLFNQFLSFISVNRYLAAAAVLILLGLGLLAVVITLFSKKRQLSFDSARTIEMDELSSVESEIAGEPEAGNSQNAGNAENTKEQADVFQTEPYFEQARWNLPGFLLLPPQKQNISVPSVDFSRGSDLFTFQYYSFLETNPGYEDFADLIRDFLLRASDIADGAAFVLFLRNPSGEFSEIVSRKGSIYLSGQNSGLSSSIVSELTADRCVYSDDGKTLHAPVSCSQGLLGALKAESDRPLFRAQVLSSLSALCRKTGETLYQAKIYEQACYDSESYLFAGMRFQDDLRTEFFRCRSTGNSSGLGFIIFSSRPTAEQMKAVGREMRILFPKPWSSYRPSSNAVSFLGLSLDSDELERRFRDLLTSLKKIDLQMCAGYADYSREMQAPEDWFLKAREAVFEAGRAGWNRYMAYSDRLQKTAAG